MASLGGSAKSNTPKPTDTEKKIAELGIREWNDYVQRWVPVENEYLGRVMNQDDTRRDLISMASAQGAIQNAGAEQAVIRGGLSPYALGAVHDERARARGLGAANAGLAADMQQMRDLQRIVTFGRGLADDSKRGLYSAVQNDLRGMQTKAEADALTRRAWGNALGTAGAIGYKWYNTPSAASGGTK